MMSCVKENFVNIYFHSFNTFLLIDMFHTRQTLFHTRQTLFHTRQTLFHTRQTLFHTRQTLACLTMPINFPLSTLLFNVV
jgi:hypothetical protein